MATAFISHTSSDDAFVARIAKGLELAGIDVWIDSGRIVPGDDILQKVEQGLSDATHVIVVFSPASLLSNWVREESHAAQLKAIAGTSRIIPVIYGAISPSAIPLLLRSRLYVDFREPDQFDNSMTQLISGFAALAEPPASQSSLEIVDFQIARRLKDGATAVELLLYNPTKRTINIKRMMICSRIPYLVMYSSLPPTVMFPLSLTIGPRTANGVVALGGAIGHEAEEWRRPVIGELVFGPYHTEFMIDMPIYIAVGPQEQPVLRIPFESVAAETESQIQVRSFLDRRVSDGVVRPMIDKSLTEFIFGTRIAIEASSGAASFVARDPLLVALVPLISEHASDELKEALRDRRL